LKPFSPERDELQLFNPGELQVLRSGFATPGFPVLLFMADPSGCPFVPAEARLLECPVFKQVPLVSLADEGDCSLSAPRFQSMSSIELVQLPEPLFQGLQEYRLTHPADDPFLDPLQRRFLELSFKLLGLLFPFRVFTPFSNRYCYQSMPLLMLDFDPCGSLDQF
jgi:hypothetical protein